MIEHREALIYMLCEAAELEHGIMCQYLFAAFTLKQDEGEDLTREELAATRRWRKVISHVATQEMLHLALVQNLLSAVGAAPHLSRRRAGRHHAGRDRAGAVRALPAFCPRICPPHPRSRSAGPPVPPRLCGGASGASTQTAPALTARGTGHVDFLAIVPP